MREVGENCRKYLKGDGTEKRIGETKILKRGKAGSRDGCLKKGEAGTPLRTMACKLKGIFLSLIFFNLVQYYFAVLTVGKVAVINIPYPTYLQLILSISPRMSRKSVSVPKYVSNYKYWFHLFCCPLIPQNSQ